MGRDAELAGLTDLAARARAGTGALVWLEGEPGIGKTRLAGAAAAAAREHGMAVLEAGADELEGHRPFGVVANCLAGGRGRQDTPGAAIAPLLDGGSALVSRPGDAAPLRGSGELEFHVSEALLVLVEELCADRPTMLVLEDLQWADPPSLGFLGRLARRVWEFPLLALCTTRGVPRREELERLITASRERGAVHIALGPLGAEASETLAAGVAGGPPGANLRAQVAGCGGNPLFVTTLLGALTAEGSIERSADGHVDVARASAPPSLALTVLGQVSLLPAEVVELLGLASVVGSAFSVVDLSLLTGRSAAALWGPLRKALAAGLLTEAGDRLAFRHDVVREALYQDLPQTVRAGLHLDFGRALAANGAPAGAVAEHLLRGAPRGDHDAVAWLERAAQEAAPRSARVAAELLEAALDIADPADPSRGRLVVELALNLVAAGRRQEGEDLCRRALEDAAYPPGEGALRLTLARSLFERGQLVDALSEAGRAAASPGLSAAERAEAVTWGIFAPMFTHDLDATEAAARRSLAAGEEAANPSVVALALTRLAHVAAFRGDFAEEERLAARARAVAEEDGTRETHQASHAHLIHAFALADCDRPREGNEAVAAGRRVYARLGMEETLRNSHHYAGYPLLWTGDWDDALAELETAATLSAESGLSWTVDVLAARATILARRNDLGAAEELVAAATRDMAAGAPAFYLGWVAWARSLLEDGRGEHEAALATLWGAWSAVTEAGVLGEQRIFAPDLARMLAYAGDRERGAQVAAAVEALARRNPELVTLRALAARCRALVDGDLAGLLRAVELYRGGPRPHEHALACEDAAVALAATGRIDDARAFADEALALYEGLGAARSSARAEGRLRAAGVRRGRRGSRRRADSGWGALTPSERRVAELAADGLSNPQIAERLVVSRHTVATHIAHVLGKLGLRSRYELAAARPE